MDDSETRNVYTKKTKASGELRNAFNTLNDGDVMVCFTNLLEDGRIEEKNTNTRRNYSYDLI